MIWVFYFGVPQEIQNMGVQGRPGKVCMSYSTKLTLCKDGGTKDANACSNEQSTLDSCLSKAKNAYTLINLKCYNLKNHYIECEQELRQEGKYSEYTSETSRKKQEECQNYAKSDSGSARGPDLSSALHRLMMTWATSFRC